MTPNYVLDEMSFLNVLMYGHATPEYDIKKNKKKSGTIEWDETWDAIDANNPANFNDTDKEITVR